uniref:Carboxypeptidase regulatory-like domain-containing protein n=1 Tax=Meloidogyne hapla TaxID=6305 RepID=A0A1I8BLC5_MELHA
MVFYTNLYFLIFLLSQKISATVIKNCYGLVESSFPLTSFDGIKVTISVQSFNLHGTVSTARGAPIKDVTITLDNFVDVKSDEEGRFVFSKVSHGRHFIQAHKPFFEFEYIDIYVSSKMNQKIIFVSKISKSLISRFLIFFLDGLLWLIHPLQ